MDEPTIELEFTERHIPELREGGVPGGEIVG
ncbi:MAG: hypothetical protein RL625_359 [Gemmatimonadota bacterium]